MSNKPGNTLRVCRLAEPSQYVKPTRQYLESLQASRTLTVCQTNQAIPRESAEQQNPHSMSNLPGITLTVCSLADYSQYVKQTRQYLDSLQASRTLTVCQTNQAIPRQSTVLAEHSQLLEQTRHS